MATITYLTLGVLLARVQKRRRMKLYLVAVATFLALLVGFSRVYLGVHWPTDVVAGWCVSARHGLLDAGLSPRGSKAAAPLRAITRATSKLSNLARRSTAAAPGLSDRRWSAA
jgi:membrane-associated phospholipid phosphatase